MAQVIRAEKGPSPLGPYSHAIRAGDDLYVSGFVGIDPATGELCSGDVQAQAAMALDHVAAVLEAASMSMQNVVKTTIYLTDMNFFSAVNAIYAQRFGSNKPARSTVAVAGLPKGALVEIEAIAKA